MWLYHKAPSVNKKENDEACISNHTPFLLGCVSQVYCTIKGELSVHHMSEPIIIVSTNFILWLITLKSMKCVFIEYFFTHCQQWKKRPPCYTVPYLHQPFDRDTHSWQSISYFVQNVWSTTFLILPPKWSLTQTFHLTWNNHVLKVVYVVMLMPSVAKLKYKNWIN